MTGMRACLLGVSMLAVGIAIGLAIPGLGEEEPRDAGDREIARVVRAELSRHFDESHRPRAQRGSTGAGGLAEPGRATKRRSRMRPPPHRR